MVFELNIDSSINIDPIIARSDLPAEPVSRYRRWQLARRRSTRQEIIVDARCVHRRQTLWERGLRAMQAPRCINHTAWMPSRASRVPSVGGQIRRGGGLDHCPLSAGNKGLPSLSPDVDACPSHQRGSERSSSVVVLGPGFSYLYVSVKFNVPLASPGRRSRLGPI